MTTSWGEAGQLVTTRGVHELMASDGRFFEAVMAALRRYCQGDWGECCADDAALNDEAAHTPGSGRTLAAYMAASHKIWIITEADRSVTTILFPSEY